MKVMMVRNYDKILDEYSIKLAAEKNGKQYLGSLFFELDKGVDEIKEVLKSVELPDDADAIQIANEAWKLSYEYGKLARDGQSWATFEHWSWVNGLASKMGAWDQREVMAGLEKEKAQIEKDMGEPGKVDIEKYKSVKAKIRNYVGM